MLDILTVSKNTPILGKDIKEWLDYHLSNETYYYDVAFGMIKYLDILDDELYCIKFISVNYDNKKKKPIVVKFLNKYHNCFNCKYRQDKDISFDDNGFPEYICICSLDNHYIGYFDEAEKTICMNWKKIENKKYFKFII